MIKAIETAYAGCRFRSRTEARWAVFFDALGLTWEYEKEGFELPSGRYLPDFWLPDLGGWIEVKGTWPTSAERKLISELMEGSGQCAAIVSGAPDLHKLDALLSCAGNYGIGRARMKHVTAAVEAALSAQFEHGCGKRRQTPLGPRRDPEDRDRMAYPMEVGQGAWVVGECDDGGGGIWVDKGAALDKPLACSYALLIALFFGHDVAGPLRMEAA